MLTPTICATAQRPQRRTLLILSVSALAITVSSCSTTGEDSVASGSSLPSEQMSDTSSDEYARDLGTSDPPSVDVVREVQPEEYSTVLEECLTGAGFPPSTPAGSRMPEWDILEEQSAAFSLAEYVCWAQYPVAAESQSSLTDEQMGLVYDFWLSETIPCLAELGYEVAEPPSRAAFVGGQLWDPRESTYTSVMLDVQSGRWENEEIVYSEQCVTDPPSDALLTE